MHPLDFTKISLKEIIQLKWFWFFLEGLNPSSDVETAIRKIGDRIIEDPQKGWLVTRKKGDSNPFGKKYNTRFGISMRNNVWFRDDSMTKEFGFGIDVEFTQDDLRSNFFQIFRQSYDEKQRETPIAALDVREDNSGKAIVYARVRLFDDPKTMVNKPLIPYVKGAKEKFSISFSWKDNLLIFRALNHGKEVKVPLQKSTRIPLGKGTWGFSFGPYANDYTENEDSIYYKFIDFGEHIYMKTQDKEESKSGSDDEDLETLREMIQESLSFISGLIDKK